MSNERLAISVTHADGSTTRWGPDESDATDIPDDLTFSTSVPGGFKDLQCSLLRRIDVTYPDEALFDTVRVYGPGNTTVWEGRVAQLPRSHGDSYGVTPGAVGWAAHLRDDPSFREIYIDRDMSQWHETPLARRQGISSLGRPQGKIPVSNGVGGVVWDLPNEALPINETTELHYDAGAGLAAAILLYNGAQAGASWAGSFEMPFAFTYTAETFNSLAAAAALTLDNVSRLATLTANRYLMMRVIATSTVTPAAGHQRTFGLLGVIGDHGLGSSTLGSGATGFLGSDVIRNIISRAAPMLDSGGVDDTDFAIPHLAFRDPVTAEQAISLINGYHAWDWGVWEDRTFFYTQPDPDRLCWEARLSDGARLDLEGDTAEQIFNGVVVSYTDGTGKQYTVGPPGADTDDTDAALEDTSPENPVNAHGIPRRWEILQLSEPTNLLGATTLGTVWLAQHSLPQRRGSLTLTSTVTHPTKGLQPVCMVRAGDYIKVADHSNSVARKIIETSYTHGTQTITLTLDNTAPKLEALLERLGVGRIGRW